MIITIDGPAGVGKGTIAKIISKSLGFKYLDSGAMYRALALFADLNGVSDNDSDRLKKILIDLHIQFIEDKDAKNTLAHEIATMGAKHAQEIAISQIEVNKAEAASGSFFKGGWRPFIGWVCGLAFAYHFILQPLLTFILATFNVSIPELPEFDMGTLLPVLGGMLGIGGLRTYEKQKGLTK